MAKEFFRVWNPKIFNVGENIYDFCNIGTIYDVEGYEQEDIDKINKLEVGELWNTGDYGNDHVIVRVK